MEGGSCQRSPPRTPECESSSCTRTSTVAGPPPHQLQHRKHKHYGANLILGTFEHTSYRNVLHLEYQSGGSFFIQRLCLSSINETCSPYAFRLLKFIWFVNVIKNSKLKAYFSKNLHRYWAKEFKIWILSHIVKKFITWLCQVIIFKIPDTTRDLKVNTESQWTSMNFNFKAKRQKDKKFTNQHLNSHINWSSGLHFVLRGEIEFDLIN